MISIYPDFFRTTSSLQNFHYSFPALITIFLLVFWRFKIQESISISSFTGTIAMECSHPTCNSSDSFQVFLPSPFLTTLLTKVNIHTAWIFHPKSIFNDYEHMKQNSNSHLKLWRLYLNLLNFKMTSWAVRQPSWSCKMQQFNYILNLSHK